MALLISALLARASKEGTEVYSETSARLLEMAARDQNTFKAVVSGMTEGQKGFMESVVKAGRGSVGTQKKVEEDDGDREPTIALRMDFGKV
jgi:hypothetical protein